MAKLRHFSISGLGTFSEILNVASLIYVCLVYIHRCAWVCLYHGMFYANRNNSQKFAFYSFRRWLSTPAKPVELVGTAPAL